MKISNICMDALNKVKDWWLLAYLYLAYNAMEPCKLFCICAFNWVFKSEINGVTHTLVRLVKLVNRTRKNFLLGLMKVWLYYPQKGKKKLSMCLTQSPSCADFTQHTSPPKSTNYQFITNAKIDPNTKVHISQ